VTDSLSESLNIMRAERIAQLCNLSNVPFMLPFSHLLNILGSSLANTWSGWIITAVSLTGVHNSNPKLIATKTSEGDYSKPINPQSQNRQDSGFESRVKDNAQPSGIA